MKPLIWGIFALLALCWTGLAAASVEMTEWLLARVASGQVTEAATAAGQWPVPEWLALWIDPRWVTTMQSAWLGLVQWLGQALPSASGLTGWVTPLLWTAWALGMVCLLVSAAALHWLAGRLKTAISPRNAPLSS